VVNQGGRHGPEAERLAQGIQRSLNEIAASHHPPPPVQPAVTPAEKPGEPATTAKKADTNPDQQAVRDLIQQMSVVFSSRSISGLEQIWPARNNGAKDNLKKVFTSAQSLSRKFDIESITIRPDGVTATAVGKYDGTIRLSSKDSPSSGNFYFRCTKKNGKWFVDDFNF